MALADEILKVFSGAKDATVAVIQAAKGTTTTPGTVVTQTQAQPSGVPSGTFGFKWDTQTVLKGLGIVALVYVGWQVLKGLFKHQESEA